MHRTQFHFVTIFALLVLLTGCGTHFKYQPTHAQSYPHISNNHGVAIIPGEDLRIDTEHPDWSRKVPTIVADALSDELKHNMLGHIPLKRFGKPEDVAAAVKFLASEEAGYITGAVLNVNGGMYM